MFPWGFIFNRRHCALLTCQCQLLPRLNLHVHVAGNEHHSRGADVTLLAAQNTETPSGRFPRLTPSRPSGVSRI